jgi:hypothetical protein
MAYFSHLFRSFHIILQFHKKLLECFSTFIFYLLVGNTAGHNDVNIQIFHKCTLFLSTCLEHIRFWLTLLYKFQHHILSNTLCHACVWPRSKQYTNTVHPTKKIFSLFLANRKLVIREGIYEVWDANLRWILQINLQFWITKVLLKTTGTHGNVVRHWLGKDAQLR